jgi:hypothetical protein
METPIPRWKPPETDRVRRHTSPRALDRIDDRTFTELLDASTHGPSAVAQRRAALDREWDVDRALMAAFAVLGGLSAALGLRAQRRRRGRTSGWFVFLFVQLGFLLNHAVRGWCPPLPVLRRLGFRTQKEIDAERRALTDRLDDLG